MNEAIAAFLGAVIGSGILLFRDWIASAFNARKRAKYLAIRVVTTLDRFTDQCAMIASDDGYLEGGKGEPRLTTAAPTPVIFPDDVDWRSIDHQLAYEILALGNKIYDAEQAINFAANFSTASDPERYIEERRYQYAKLGLEASRLGRNLRDTHDLHRQTFVEWNPEQKLEQTLTEIEAERVRLRELSAAIG